MEKANIFTMMAVITMEIGLKARCRDMVNCMIVMEMFNMKDNGKMITMREKGLCLD